jgi:hypothetical protein
MYRVNVTPADSFNDPGGGLNYEHDYEHDEEHDEEHDKVHHLRTEDLNTEAFNKLNLSTEKRKSLIQKIQDLYIIYSKNIQLKTFIDQYEKLENKRYGKDKHNWVKNVIQYCKDGKFDIGAKPEPTRKNANKENAKAHHLNHFSVEEYTDKKGHHFLKVYEKEKHHHNHHPTTVAQVDSSRTSHAQSSAARKFPAAAPQFQGAGRMF